MLVYFLPCEGLSTKRAVLVDNHDLMHGFSMKKAFRVEKRKGIIPDSEVI